MNKEWEYYNHALVPTTAPHVVPDTSWMKDRKMWKELSDGRYPLFARWVTDFDCQEETQWWYCIKDNPLDLSQLKYKKRWTINQGLKNVDVRLICPAEYAQELAEVNIAARLGYGEIFDTAEEKSQLVRGFLTSDYDSKKIEFIGAFLKENGLLIGYGIYEIYSDWVSQSVIKTNPEYLKCNVNAAMVYFAVNRYMSNQFSVKYISNGSKNISHETNYHEYLMKYFGFRKAYCRLHIYYRPLMRIMVKILFPIRRLLYEKKSNRFMNNVASILYMEEICREGETRR